MKYAVVVCKYILKVSYLDAQFIEFIEYLLLFKTCESCKSHICDVVCLDIGKAEPCTQAFLSLGNVFRGLHDIYDFVDIIKSYFQTL